MRRQLDSIRNSLPDAVIDKISYPNSNKKYLRQISMEIYFKWQISVKTDPWANNTIISPHPKEKFLSSLWKLDTNYTCLLASQLRRRFLREVSLKSQVLIQVELVLYAIRLRKPQLISSLLMIWLPMFGLLLIPIVRLLKLIFQLLIGCSIFRFMKIGTRKFMQVPQK